MDVNSLLQELSCSRLKAVANFALMVVKYNNFSLKVW
jgi:hypothetical protein